MPAPSYTLSVGLVQNIGQVINISGIRQNPKQISINATVVCANCVPAFEPEVVE